MRELIELQTGQVAFISGLMSGFALSVAAHVLRYGLRSNAAQLAFVGLLTSSLLFLISLYVDVRLTIELAGYEQLPQGAEARLVAVRSIGTMCATAAFVIFVCSIGLLGWLATIGTGIMSTVLAGATLLTLWFLFSEINGIRSLLASAAAPVGG